MDIEQSINKAFKKVSFKSCRSVNVSGSVGGSLLGVVAKQEGKMVLWSAQILEHVKVRMILLNWRK